jgi:hypothetical protein
VVEPGTVRRLLETIEQRLSRLERASEVDLGEYAGVLVRGYAAIVPEKVHSTLGQVEDVRQYVRALGSYLEEQGALPE